MSGIQEEQEYSRGEEPEAMDRDSNVVSKGYVPGFLLANAIEYLLDEKSQKELEDYLKESRIPGAKSYAKQVATFKLWDYSSQNIQLSYRRYRRSEHTTLERKPDGKILITHFRSPAFVKWGVPQG